MMGEPLFDEISAAFVLCGLAAMLVLRSAAECSEPEGAKTRGVVGHVLLGIAVSLLLFRWAAGVTSLPGSVRPHLLWSGSLAAACGIGLIAGVKAVLADATVQRASYAMVSVACMTIALCIASAWSWAFLLLTLSIVGAVLWRCWLAARIVVEDSEPRDASREPVLVAVVSAALLVLLLGTWEHAATNETQRRTRSTRYSAWPRVTALRDAWERTGWVAKPSDDRSAEQVVAVASREQDLAVGLGTLLLLVIVAARRRAAQADAETEVDHAG